MIDGHPMTPELQARYDAMAKAYLTELEVVTKEVYADDLFDLSKAEEMSIVTSQAVQAFLRPDNYGLEPHDVLAIFHGAGIGIACILGQVSPLQQKLLRDQLFKGMASL